MAETRASVVAPLFRTASTELPMWTEWGVRDAGHLVHSLGCTLLTAAGRDSGYAAVSEVPAPREGPFAHIDEDVRSDSAWFDRKTRKVALLAEFERYAGKEKDLGPKVEALLLAQSRWGCPDATLLLAYWSIGLVTVPDHASLRRIVREGFTSSSGVRVTGNAGAALVFYQFIVRAGGDGLLRLEDVIQRGEP